MSKLSRIEGLVGFLSFDARTLRYFSRGHGLGTDNDNDKQSISWDTVIREAGKLK